jgi:signal transduction histidine kinase
MYIYTPCACSIFLVIAMKQSPTRFFTCIILLLAHFPISGQNQEKEIDSLKTELHKKDLPDTLRALTLMEISMRYQGFQPDSSLSYALACLDFSKEITYRRGEADALLHLGRLRRDGNNDADALNQMFAALKIYREIDDQVQIANSLNDISIVYANSGDLKKALEYFLQALEVFRRRKDERGESYALNNIGLIYQDLNDEPKAIHYFRLSMDIKKKHHDLYGISRGYINLGSIAEHHQRWNEALSYYLKADSIAVVMNDIQAHASHSVYLARVMLAQGKMPEAAHYASVAEAKAREVKLLNIRLNATRILADVAEKRGRFKEALVYQKQCNEFADSLNSRANKENLEELKAKFNFEENEREIAFLKKDKELQNERLHRKNLLTYTLAGSIAFMLLVIGLLALAYYTSRSKRNILALKNVEIQRQKDDLDTLNKEKDRFFSILSHDLKGPLNSLRGFSYLVTGHADKMSPEELSMIGTKIDSSLDSLTELINNILEWSTTSSGKRKWTFDQISTTGLIRKNMTLYQGMAEAKDVRLVFVPQEDHVAYGDYYAIDTIIRNLLSNSIKFSRAHDEVQIIATRQNGMVCIAVKDQGIGMPPEILDKLFSLNENVVQPGTNNEKGTGLGLTLCKELVKENHGEMRVISTPGKGSEFTVCIPEYTPPA